MDVFELENCAPCEHVEKESVSARCGKAVEISDSQTR